MTTPDEEDMDVVMAAADAEQERRSKRAREADDDLWQFPLVVEHEVGEDGPIYNCPTDDTFATGPRSTPIASATSGPSTTIATAS